MPKRTPFIAPSNPVLRSAPPTGPGWSHEIKHDGWRAQLHRSYAGPVIFSKNGKDISGRFAPVLSALRQVPACILDAEIVGCDADGVPDFHALTAGNARGFCAWCFDLLSIDGKDVRREPLEERRARLAELLAGADGDLLRFSEAFTDAEELLIAAAKMGLEGIVSKRLGQSYVSGKNHGWVKVKTAIWREANRDRWELFERR